MGHSHYLTCQKLTPKPNEQKIWNMKDSSLENSIGGIELQIKFEKKKNYV